MTEIVDDHDVDLAFGADDRPLLRRIQRGVNLIITMLVLFVTIGILIGSIVATTNSPLAQDVLVLFSAVVAFAMYYGWWQMVSTDPRLVGHEFDAATLRRMVRIAIIVGCVVLALQVVGLAVAWPAAVASAIEQVDTLAGLVMFFAGIMYIRWIGMRLGRPKLHDRARATQHAMSVALTSLGLAYAAQALGGPAAVAGVLLIVTGIGSVVALIMYIVTLVILGNELKRALYNNPADRHPDGPGSLNPQGS